MKLNSANMNNTAFQGNLNPSKVFSKAAAKYNASKEWRAFIKQPGNWDDLLNYAENMDKFHYKDVEKNQEILNRVPRQFAIRFIKKAREFKDFDDFVEFVASHKFKDALKQDLTTLKNSFKNLVKSIKKLVKPQK